MRFTRGALELGNGSTGGARVTATFSTGGDGDETGSCDEGARCAGVAGLIEPSANQLPAITLRMTYLNVRLTELSLLVDKT